MFRPPTVARIAAPTGVHISYTPDPQQGVFAVGTITFDANADYYTHGIVYINGVLHVDTIYSPGSTGGLIDNSDFAAGTLITAGAIRQPYSSPSGGDSVVTMAPESYVSLPP